MSFLGSCSRLSSHGSVALVLSGLVLSGVGFNAQAAGDQGILRLQLGATNQFTITKADVTKNQRLAASGLKGSCELVSTKGDPKLAVLSATIGGSPGPVGFGPTSIGVYDGPKGVPCYRVSESAHETITFALGSDLKTFAGANAFDRLELDIEVKSNAKLKLTTYFENGTPIDEYYLTSGSSNIPGDTTPNLVQCRAQSDSGPDSGANDNCRWEIDAFGQKFTIEPLIGEFSLEGGGDHALDPFGNNSLIYLTSVEVGTLSCGTDSTSSTPIGSGANSAACQTFGPPSAGTGTGYSCPDIFYAFRDIDGDTKGCEFLKGPDLQLAASMDITFPVEARTDLYNVPPTYFRFPGLDGLFQTDVCEGDILANANGSNPTIDIDTLPVDDTDDAVPGNGFIDWACILEQTIEYLGTDADPKMQVHQILLFWGDPAAIRF